MSKYNKNSKDYSIKYIKEKLKRVEVRFQKEYYDSVVEPAIKKSGMPAVSFIKAAVEEKIERMNGSK